MRVRRRSDLRLSRCLHRFAECSFQVLRSKNSATSRQDPNISGGQAGMQSRITSRACTPHQHQQILAPIEPGRTSPGQWEPPPDLRPGFNSLGHCAPPPWSVRIYLRLANAKLGNVLTSTLSRRIGNRRRFNDRLDGLSCPARVRVNYGSGTLDPIMSSSR